METTPDQALAAVRAEFADKALNCFREVSLAAIRLHEVAARPVPTYPERRSEAIEAYAQAQLKYWNLTNEMSVASGNTLGKMFGQMFAAELSKATIDLEPVIEIIERACFIAIGPHMAGQVLTRQVLDQFRSLAAKELGR